jgi:hypothetical protein
MSEFAVAAAVSEDGSPITPLGAGVAIALSIAGIMLVLPRRSAASRAARSS